MERVARLPRLIARKLELMNTFQEIGQGYAGFQACERRTQAEVNAVPERQVRIRIARDVKSPGVAELRRITVRRTDHCEDQLARWDHLSVYLNLVPRRARHP